MKELVPIKVIIRKGFSGGKKRAIYPNFNLIDPNIRKGIPWSIYIDTEGTGWIYDKVENIGLGNETGACVTLVPEDFAQAAAVQFPSDVSILTEAELEDFWDNRSKLNEPDELVDVEVLQAIYYKRQLGLLTPEEATALDPDNPARGIRKNTKKRWKDHKAKIQVTIKERA